MSITMIMVVMNIIIIIFRYPVGLNVPSVSMMLIQNLISFMGEVVFNFEMMIITATVNSNNSGVNDS